MAALGTDQLDGLIDTPDAAAELAYSHTFVGALLLVDAINELRIIRQALTTSAK